MRACNVAALVNLTNQTADRPGSTTVRDRSVSPSNQRRSHGGYE